MAKMAGNAVDGEHQVGELHQQQHQEERRGHAPAVLHHPEPLPVVALRQGEPAPRQANHRVVLRIDRLVLAQGHLYAGQQQNAAEDVDHPVPLVQHVRAGGDKSAAHHQRAQDAPEQHAVLIRRGNGEVREDEGDDEDVVHRQRLLHQVAGQEFQRRLPAREVPDARVEQQRERDPDGRPCRRLAQADRVCLAMEDAQVQRQHDEHGRVEPHPQPDRIRH